MHVTVIGAGVAGLTSALALAGRGCAVEVVERGPALGADVLLALCRRDARTLVRARECRGAGGRARPRGAGVLADDPRGHGPQGQPRPCTTPRRARPRALRPAHPQLPPPRRCCHCRARARPRRPLRPRPVLPRRGSSRPACRPGRAGWAPGGAGRADPLRRRCRGAVRPRRRLPGPRRPRPADRPARRQGRDADPPLPGGFARKAGAAPAPALSALHRPARRPPCS